jgi:hypothetical protein
LEVVKHKAICMGSDRNSQVLQVDFKPIVVPAGKEF